MFWLDLILLAGAIYMGIGAIFGVIFVWRGASAIDHAAQSSTWGFRIMILPGAAALWPLLLRRWLTA